MNVRIGTSGYSYADWVGPFYPQNLPKSCFLEYYSSHFNILELNFSFYQMPRTATVASMVNRSSGRLNFIVKAHRQFTHASEPDLDLTLFLSRLEPMLTANVLSGILFQFPFSFRNSPQNRKRLERISEGLGSITGIIEFRNSDWIDLETFQLLSDLNLSICSLDQPDLLGLPGVVSALTTDQGYIRFHGRNKDKWWDNNEAWERYDYLYSIDELMEWSCFIREIRDRCKTLYVLFNNHYQGQAVRNAQLFSAYLSV